MNISELAQRLDLAVSTVSRVLSGNAEKYRISEKTARRIREAAARYRVAPDPLGAGLRRGKLGMVGLLVPDITNPFFSHLARELELKLRESGIAVQLCDSAEDPATELDLLQTLLTRRLDGLILAPVGVESDEFSVSLRNSPFPVVLLDRIVEGLGTPFVTLDNFAAGRMAAQRLLDSGHARIACLRGALDSPSDKERLRGVKEAIRDAGLEETTLTVVGSGYSRRESLHAARELLAGKPRPAAVVTLSGQGILGVLEVARELGLSIPRDLSVVAFDEQPWSGLVDPPLTTVAQPIAEMAAAAAEVLDGCMNAAIGKNEPEKRVFQAQLVERASVSAAPE